MTAVKATRTFAKRAVKLLGEAGVAALGAYLAARPESGAIVPGSGGVRKLRWRLPGRGRRGGARVLHLYLKHRETTWLLDLYAKNEKSDLSAAYLKAIRALVAAIKAAPE
jgi:hypothetical protein